MFVAGDLKKLHELDHNYSSSLKSETTAKCYLSQFSWKAKLSFEMLHDHFKQWLPSEKPDSMKISNPGFLIVSEIIAIIFKSTFYENST